MIRWEELIVFAWDWSIRSCVSLLKTIERRVNKTRLCVGTQREAGSPDSIDWANKGYRASDEVCWDGGTSLRISSLILKGNFLELAGWIEARCLKLFLWFGSQCLSGPKKREKRKRRWERVNLKCFSPQISFCLWAPQTRTRGMNRTGWWYQTLLYNISSSSDKWPAREISRQTQKTQWWKAKISARISSAPSTIRDRKMRTIGRLW